MNWWMRPWLFCVPWRTYQEPLHLVVLHHVCVSKRELSAACVVVAFWWLFVWFRFLRGLKS